MANNRKLTLSNPMDFNVARLVMALNLDGPFFKSDKLDNKITISINDVMQMIKRKSASEQHRQDNYAPFISFEMTEDNRLKTIELNSNIRISTLQKTLENKDYPECKILNIYAAKANLRLDNIVQEISKENQLHYQSVQYDDRLIAYVFQAQYAFAEGPKKDIKHLGTSRVRSCVALAMVAKPENQDPRVVLMHLDAKTDIKGSITEAIENLKTNKNEISAYMVSGQKINDFIVNVFDILQEEEITPKVDFANDRLIIDLETGLPVKSFRTEAEQWLVPDQESENILTTRMFSHFALEKASKAYDFKAIPGQYIKVFDPD